MLLALPVSGLDMLIGKVQPWASIPLCMHATPVQTQSLSIQGAVHIGHGWKGKKLFCCLHMFGASHVCELEMATEYDCNYHCKSSLIIVWIT